jgi:hypothetical protein
MENREYESLPVVGELPAGGHYSPRDGEALLRRIVGSRIMAIGAPPETRIEGGGLIIDYACDGENFTRRAVFGFNENGMWVEYEGCSSNSHAAILDDTPR